MENYYTSSTLLLPLAALSLVSCNSQKKEEVRQPNIIFMMTDDHTTQAMSCYGGNLIQTPNMDRIANEGIRFDNCYAVNALSGPSRACILTGKFSHENGFTDNASTFNGDQQTFPKLLQQAGYQTAMIGNGISSANRKVSTIGVSLAANMSKVTITILISGKTENIS